MCELVKVSDIIVTMSFDNLVWNNLEYEPLILSIVLLFYSRAPWKIKSTKYVDRCEGNLQNMWKTTSPWRRIFCAEFGHNVNIGRLVTQYDASNVIG